MSLMAEEEMTPLEIGDAQSLEQQLLHAVGGQQIGEGVRHLLGSGFVVILAVAERSVPPQS